MVNRSHLHKRVLSAVAMLFVCFVVTSARSAETNNLDYPQLFKERVLTCIHPTAHPETTTVEVVKGPTKDGNISTTRLKVFYRGWIKSNSMDVDMLVRQVGSLRQLKVNLLSDSGISLSSCDLITHWDDF